MGEMAVANFATRARSVGVCSDNDWPYGPNTDYDARADLVSWAEAQKVRYSPRAGCLHWISTGRCNVQLCMEDRNSYNFMDHVTGWTRAGKPAVLVCQPYGLHGDDIRQLTELSTAWPVEVQIDGTGWYGHGTTFVQLWRSS